MARKTPPSASRAELATALTGDLIESSRIPAKRRGQLLRTVDAALSPGRLRKALSGGRVLGRQVFRGDAFQVLIDRPSAGLAAALHIMADLRSQEPKLGVALGARIAVGIGSVDYFSAPASGKQRGRVAPARSGASSAGRGNQFRGDGEAFRLSGHGLDGMKKNRRITVHTPWPEVDAELAVGCRFLDGLLAEMSDTQALALCGALAGMTQREVADAEGKSQSAIAQRLRRVQWNAVRALLERFGTLVDRYAK